MTQHVRRQREDVFIPESIGDTENPRRTKASHPGESAPRVAHMVDVTERVRRPTWRDFMGG